METAKYTKHYYDSSNGMTLYYYDTSQVQVIYKWNYLLLNQYSQCSNIKYFLQFFFFFANQNLDDISSSNFTN